MGTDLNAAAALAASADYAIVFVATLSHEGGDRASLSLDDGCDPDQYGQCKGNNKNQNAMIAAVAAASPNTIVVASVPGAVLMPWSTKVSAILTNFMPGQQAGYAIADVLFGNVNPSGKLPITLPNKENETEMSQAQWPGIPDANNPAYCYYEEKLLVGYRFYDAHDIKFSTGFPFGHGLSYTSFTYSNLVINSSMVSVTVKNAGSVCGAEVVQLYLGFPQSAGEPPLQLKGFHKTAILKADESEIVSMNLRPRDFSIWNEKMHGWSLVKGSFQVKVGSSSRDLRIEGMVDSTTLFHSEIHV